MADRTAGFVLWPRGPFHVGAHADDLTRVRAFPSSDTIFGALCWAARQLRGNSGVQQWLEPFLAGEPPLLFTSALPVVEQSGRRTWFVPMPTRRPGLAPDALADRKMLRRAEYIDSTLLAWLNGTAEGSPPGRVGGAIKRADELQPSVDWAESALRPHVTVDRVTAGSALFSAGDAHFRRGSATDPRRTGMFIGILGRTAGALGQLEPLMHLLSEAGIGGERSTGAGAFALEMLLDCPLQLTPMGTGMLLSMCWPTATEVDAGILDVPAGFGYRLAERSGWVSSPDWHGYRSRAVMMLREGSHVARTGLDVTGGMADVTPDPGDAGRHRVYRYGFGCFLEEGLALERSP